MNQSYLQRLSRLSKIDLLAEKKDGTLILLYGSEQDSALYISESLRSRLKKNTDLPSVPCMLQDEYDTYFACFTAHGIRYYTGPVTTDRMTGITRRQFYQSYGITSEDVRGIRHLSLQEITDYILLLYEAATGKSCSRTDLLLHNHIESSTQTSLEKELSAFVLHEEEENDDEAYRHTYYEEQRLLQAVSEGRPEDALALNLAMDADSGRLSNYGFSHWRNLAIVGITLCSRAAISGGISPEASYRISGFYIQKCDSCTDPAQIIHYRNQAILELASRVQKRLAQHKSSSYTERCKDYINKHYREKIYLETIAELLGISPTYLSRLFKKENGDSIQDYINQVRIDRAANMLIYSDATLPAIAAYVHFPSQSYFGRVFLKLKGMTPKQYRDRYRAAEFTGAGGSPALPH